MISVRPHREGRSAGTCLLQLQGRLQVMIDEHWALNIECWTASYLRAMVYLVQVRCRDSGTSVAEIYYYNIIFLTVHEPSMLVIKGRVPAK